MCSGACIRYVCVLHSGVIVFDWKTLVKKLSSCVRDIGEYLVCQARWKRFEVAASLARWQTHKHWCVIDCRTSSLVLALTATSVWSMCFNCCRFNPRIKPCLQAEHKLACCHLWRRHLNVGEVTCFRLTAVLDNMKPLGGFSPAKLFGGEEKNFRK